TPYRRRAANLSDRGIVLPPGITTGAVPGARARPLVTDAARLSGHSARRELAGGAWHRRTVGEHLARAKKYHAAIHDVLWRKWDRIGVSHLPGATLPQNGCQQSAFSGQPETVPVGRPSLTARTPLGRVPVSAEPGARSIRAACSIR